MMKIKRLTDSAIIPSKAHAGDLGFDLYASDQTTIWSGQVKLISTGIAIQFPQGYGALIRDRSSVATHRGLFVVAGVIDNGYTGEIKIALYNTHEAFQVVQQGEKIAQMILVPVVDCQVMEVDEIVSADQRGKNGFGSSGTNINLDGRTNKLPNWNSV